MRERIQLARRQDPYPWTWEPFALWGLALLMVLLLGVQAGRGVANWVAGAGFTWPPVENVTSSVFAVIAGNSAAGLAHPHQLGRLAGPGLLRGSLILTEVVVFVGYSIVTFLLLRTWGPWRVLGMASREEAERLLGRTRLRKVAGVVRPDLYGHQQSAAAHTIVCQDPEPDSTPLGRGLPSRFPPSHTTDDGHNSAYKTRKRTWR